MSGAAYNGWVAHADRLVDFGARVRAARLAARLTQAAVAAKLGRSQSFVSKVELGRYQALTIRDADRICSVLGATLVFGLEAPMLVGGERQRDTLHARCVAYIVRRFESAGWPVAREVRIGELGRPGWIDVLAIDPATRVLLVIEVKTSLVDLGGIERQLGWYEPEAAIAARRMGWRPLRTVAVALLLATESNDTRVRENAAGINQAFPRRWRDILALLRGEPVAAGRALAMIDPASKAQAWIRPTTLDGRRTRAPYRIAADALRPRDGRDRELRRAGGRPRPGDTRLGDK